MTISLAGVGEYRLLEYWNNPSGGDTVSTQLSDDFSNLTTFAFLHFQPNQHMVHEVGYPSSHLIILPTGSISEHLQVSSGSALHHFLTNQQSDFIYS
jgi:hypothetical protein